MAVVETIDKNSGAIIFKKDKESKDLEYALERIASLEKKVKSLEKRVKELESTKSE